VYPLLLKEIDCVIEEYETDCLDAIYADIEKVSEMKYRENCFVNGLVRCFKPQKILEIGVSAGGSSCVLLNAIKDSPGAALHSVDWSKEYYRNLSKTSGWKAQELFPDNPQWTLHLGVDIAEIIEDRIGGGIDFLLLDTAHVHPAETLSFLSAFPYLNKNAVVVLHDVNHFFIRNSRAYATKILWDAVAADKVTLRTFENGYIHPNISAFQVNEDTGKYIRDVVCSLFFPWGTEEPARILQATEVILKTKYPKELYELYVKGVKQNQIYLAPTLEERFLRIRKNLRETLKMCLPASAVAFIRETKWKLRKILSR
jgi:predicted O-methyltransferase YrrM